MVPNLLVGDRLVVSKYPYGWSWVSASFHLLPRSTWRIAPGTPEYGDIVIVVPPYRAEDYIKRVVALPGDRIAVVNGQIILNGEPVPQEFEPPVRIPVDQQTCDDGFGKHLCLDDFADTRVRLPDGREVYEPPTRRETLPNGASYLIIDHFKGSEGDNYGEVVVPEGHVFLMGDNRDHSADSRFPARVEAGGGLGGPVPISSIGGRAEFTTFSLDGSATWNPLTWIPALRGERAWLSLRPEIRGAAGPMADTDIDGTAAATQEQPGDNRASPTEIANPALRFEAKRALVWVLVVGLVVLSVYISRALLVIFGAMVFASMLDGGERLVGRVFKIGRGWRLAIVLGLAVLFFVWLGQFAGSQISREAAQLPEIVTLQADRFVVWLDAQGFAIDPGDVQGIAGQLLTGSAWSRGRSAACSAPSARCS
jgi:signal peptidase I